MLPRGLNLFYADYIDVDTGYQYIEYVVGRNYDSAFKRWYKETCSCFYVFDYYFYEIEDEESINDFLECHENIKAGIYPVRC